MSTTLHSKALPLLRLALRDPDFEAAVLAMGYERGYNERADVIYQTLDGADLNRMWDEFQQTLAIRAQQRDRLINMLTYGVTDVTETVRYPTSDDFEEASEYGQPKGIRLGPQFNVGFDFRWYDLAIRYTWMFLAEATQRQVEALNNDALDADGRLLFTKTLKTVFNPLNVNSSIRNIPVTMYKFWNADGIAPPPYKNFVFDGTHSHYLTSGGAALASAGLASMEDTLYHHGYNTFTGTRLVLMLSRQEGRIIRGARVVNGWMYDFIPNQNVGGGVILPAALGIVGAPGGPTFPGEIGTYGPWHVVEEDYIPSGYVFGFATGGPDQLTNPIGLREHANAGLRGLQLVRGQQDADYPLVESYYRHGFGTGVRHRGAGVVMQITANATYTVPALYA